MTYASLSQQVCHQEARASPPGAAFDEVPADAQFNGRIHVPGKLDQILSANHGESAHLVDRVNDYVCFHERTVDHSAPAGGERSAGHIRNALLPLLIAVIIICSNCSLFTYGIVGADSEDG